MTYDQIAARWGTQQQIADFFGVSQATVAYWKKAGIPLARQWEIQERTNGELKADQPWKKGK